MPVKSKEAPYQTFHPFPRLPTELQWKVYEYCLPEPRVIRVKSNAILQARGIAMTPALLHVSHDARRFMLRYYNFAFTGFLVRPVFFNWGIDILFFKTERDLRSFFQLRLDNKSKTIASLKNRGEQIKELGNLVKQIMICSEGWQNYESLSLLTNFKVLRRIIIRSENKAEPNNYTTSQQDTYLCLYNLMVHSGIKRSLYLHLVLKEEMELMDIWFLACRDEMKRRKAIRKDELRKRLSGRFWGFFGR